MYYLDYLGEKLPVRITFRVEESMFDETGVSMDNPAELQKVGLSILIPLLYHSLKAGYKAEEKVFDIKREDEEHLRDILDECSFDFMSNIDKFYYRGKAGNTSKKK
jgi:hypothetical protein